MPGFIGRQAELERLVETTQKRSASFIVVRGRLSPEEIVNENPFYQHKTARQPGCQIDYLIQTKFDTLYVCEIKFSRNEITSTIIPEIRAKIGALSRPRGMSCRPVLIHVNGVSEEVTDSDYFAQIVDMGGLLN